MSPLPRLARSLLILHALLTIAQGLYCITNPQGWVGRAGPLFEGSGENGVRVVGTSPLLFTYTHFNTLSEMHGMKPMIQKSDDVVLRC